MEPHNCWEFIDCVSDVRDTCPIFISDYGKDHYDFSKYAYLKTGNTFEEYSDCPFYMEVYSQLPHIVEETIKLELNASELYSTFSNAFPEDSGFWNELSKEEENHAILLKTARKMLLSRGAFPVELLSPALENLREVNSQLIFLLDDCKKRTPSREMAFQTAITVEEAPGEIDYQNAMEKPSQIGFLSLFQELNRNNRDHAKRIRSYMRDHGIQEVLRGD